MKTIIVPISIVLIVVLAAVAEHPKETDAHSQSISLTLDNVCLSDITRMLSRISGFNITFDPSDPTFSQRASVAIRNKPWKPFFRTILAQHGLVLLEDATGSETCAIVRAESEATAARYHAAKDAVIMVDAVLAELDKGNLAKTRTLLVEYRAHNDELMKAVSQTHKTPPTHNP